MTRWRGVGPGRAGAAGRRARSGRCRSGSWPRGRRSGRPARPRSGRRGRRWRTSAWTGPFASAAARDGAVDRRARRGCRTARRGSGAGRRQPAVSCEPARVAGEQAQRGALAGQAQGDGPADAGAGAGDDDVASFHGRVMDASQLEWRGGDPRSEPLEDRRPARARRRRAARRARPRGRRPHRHATTTQVLDRDRAPATRPASPTPLYTEAGATVVPDAARLYAEADLIVRVGRPSERRDRGAAARAPSSSPCSAPLSQPRVAEQLAGARRRPRSRWTWCPRITPGPVDGRPVLPGHRRRLPRRARWPPPSCRGSSRC